MWSHEHSWTHMSCTSRPNSLQVVQPWILTSGTSYTLSSKTDHVGVTTMERLNQGHLHPRLEVLRLTCLGWESNPNSSKELFEQPFNSYSGHRRLLLILGHRVKCLWTAAVKLSQCSPVVFAQIPPARHSSTTDPLIFWWVRSWGLVPGDWHYHYTPRKFSYAVLKKQNARVLFKKYSSRGQPNFVELSLDLGWQ